LVGAAIARGRPAGRSGVTQKVLQFQSRGTLRATSGMRFPRGVVGEAAMGVAGAAAASSAELLLLLLLLLLSDAEEAPLEWRLLVRLRHSLNCE